MKKILLFVLLLIPFFVLAEDTCNQDDIKIESIVLDSTSGNIEETNNPNTDNNQVNLGLKMNVIDDSITYKLVITNTSNQDYTFDKNSLSTDYINYDITYENNSNIVKAGESKTIYLKLSYTNKPSVDKLENGVLKDNSNITFNLKKEEVESTIIEKVIKNNIVKKIVNPETGDSLLIYLIALIISIIVIIILIRHKRIRNISMFIIILLLTTQVVKAVCTCQLDINANIEIDVREAVFLPGKEVNIKMKELAGDDTSTLEDRYTFKNESIIAIKESEIEPSDSNKQEKNIVSTADSEYPIYMWFDNGTIYWWSEDKTPSLNENASDMFTFLSLLNNIEGLKEFDVSKTKILNSLFSASTSLKNIDAISKWNTSNVKNISFIFDNCTSLENVDGIKNWNVKKVISMRQVFCGDINLEEIDLSNWETPSLTDMVNMFGMWNANGTRSLDSKLKKIILSSKFDTSKVTNMTQAFVNLTALEDYSFLQYFNTSNLEYLYGTFEFNLNLKTLDHLKNWDTSKVKDMSYLFNYNTSLNDVSAIENWDVSSVTSMRQMFCSDVSLEEINLSNWDTSSLTIMTNMFGMWNSNGSYRGDSKMKKIDLSGRFNTSKVTDMTMVFVNLVKLENIYGMENWDTSNTERMYSMFSHLKNIKELDLSSFNTSKVTTFKNMFSNCNNLEHIYVGTGWNTSANTDTTSQVFTNDIKLHNLKTSNTDYSSLIYAHTGEGGYLELKTND